MTALIPILGLSIGGIILTVIILESQNTKQQKQIQDTAIIEQKNIENHDVTLFQNMQNNGNLAKNLGNTAKTPFSEGATVEDDIFGCLGYVAKVATIFI